MPVPQGRPSGNFRLLAAASVVFLALLTLVIVRWKSETSIAVFLPEHDQELYEVTTALTDSSVTRRMILTVGPPTLGRASLVRASRNLEKRLATTPRFSRIVRGPSADLVEKYLEKTFPARFGYLSLTPEKELPALLGDPEALAERARLLRENLGAPDGGLARTLAAGEPWGLFARHLKSPEPSSTLSVDDGQFFSADGHAVLFLELRDSAFDSKAQKEALAALDEAVRETTLSVPGLRCESTGVNRFAVAAEEQTKSDISRISGISTALLLAVYLWLFRRPSRLFYCLVPLLFGTLAGIAVSLVVFGRVHLITLAFGSSLIGVAIDFPVHLIAHHDLGNPGRTTKETLGAVVPSLLLAGATTIVGLGALGFSGFPGLREMAVFGAVGVAAGLVSVTALAPLLGASQAPSTALKATAQGLFRIFAWVQGQRALRASLFLVAIGFALYGVAQARFEKSLAALNAPDPQLLEIDRRVRLRADGTEGDGQLVISLGRTKEEALARSEAAFVALRDASPPLEKMRVRSVHDWVRSEALQARHRTVLASLANLETETLDAYEKAGFDRTAFASFSNDLRATLEGTKAELAVTALETPALEAVFQPFFVTLKGKEAVLLHLDGTVDATRVRALLRQHPKSYYFDQRESLAQAFVAVQKNTIGLLILGVGLVSALVFTRYRDLRKATAALVAPLLSCLVTVGVLSAFGEQLTLIHILSLLLVLSMGEDYGIFLVDAALSRGKDATPAALVSICLANVSTLISFGLLGLSTIPALRALGITVALGDFFSLVLAPLGLFLLKREAEVAP